MFFIQIAPKSIMGLDYLSNFGFFPLSSTGARPKLTERNSMDSVELWKFSALKVTPFFLFSAKIYGTLGDGIIIISPQNGENQDSESIPRRSKSQPSQPGKRKGYPDSQSSDDRPWLDSPVDADDITVQVPPPVSVSIRRRTEFLFRKLNLILLRAAANTTQV